MKFQNWSDSSNPLSSATPVRDFRVLYRKLKIVRMFAHFLLPERTGGALSPSMLSQSSHDGIK